MYTNFGKKNSMLQSKISKGFFWDKRVNGAAGALAYVYALRYKKNKYSLQGTAP